MKQTKIFSLFFIVVLVSGLGFGGAVTAAVPSSSSGGFSPTDFSLGDLGSDAFFNLPSEGLDPSAFFNLDNFATSAFFNLPFFNVDYAEDAFFNLGYTEEVFFNLEYAEDAFFNLATSEDAFFNLSPEHQAFFNLVFFNLAFFNLAADGDAFFNLDIEDDAFFNLSAEQQAFFNLMLEDLAFFNLAFFNLVFFNLGIEADAFFNLDTLVDAFFNLGAEAQAFFNLAFFNLAFFNLAFFNLAFSNLGLESEAFFNLPFFNLPFWNLPFFNVGLSSDAFFNLAFFNLPFFNLPFFNLPFFNLGVGPDPFFNLPFFNLPFFNLPFFNLPFFNLAFFNLLFMSQPFFNLGIVDNPFFNLPFFNLPFFNLPFFNLGVDENPFFNLPFFNLPFFNLPFFNLPFFNLYQSSPFFNLPFFNLVAALYLAQPFFNLSGVEDNPFFNLEDRSDLGELRSAAADMAKDHKDEVKEFRDAVGDIQKTMRLTLIKSLVQMLHSDYDAEVQWDVASLFSDGYEGDSSSSSVKVAVLDTGVATDHPDLDVTWTYDATGEGYYDYNGHGTHVAGTIAANHDGVGMTGVAPNVELYGVKVIAESSGEGEWPWLEDAIYKAVAGPDGVVGTADDADVINMSFGSGSEVPPTYVHDALRWAKAQGVTLVAAAGNDGDGDLSTDEINYPAAFDEVIGVGASTYTGDLASFSSSGPWVEMTAPGDIILSTFLDGTYQYWGGTSMATPHVSGIVAMLLSTHGSMPVGDFGDTGSDTIRGLLHSYAQDGGTAGWDAGYGYGIVQYS